MFRQRMPSAPPTPLVVHTRTDSSCASSSSAASSSGTSHSATDTPPSSPGYESADSMSTSDGIHISRVPPSGSSSSSYWSSSSRSSTGRTATRNHQSQQGSPSRSPNVAHSRRDRRSPPVSPPFVHIFHGSDSHSDGSVDDSGYESEGHVEETRRATRARRPVTPHPRAREIPYAGPLADDDGVVPFIPPMHGTTTPSPPPPPPAADPNTFIPSPMGSTFGPALQSPFAFQNPGAFMGSPYANTYPSPYPSGIPSLYAGGFPSPYAPGGSPYFQTPQDFINYHSPHTQQTPVIPNVNAHFPASNGPVIPGFNTPHPGYDTTTLPNAQPAFVAAPQFFNNTPALIPQSEFDADDDPTPPVGSIPRALHYQLQQYYNPHPDATDGWCSTPSLQWDIVQQPLEAARFLNDLSPSGIVEPDWYADAFHPDTPRFVQFTSSHPIMKALLRHRPCIMDSFEPIKVGQVLQHIFDYLHEPLTANEYQWLAQTPGNEKTLAAAIKRRYKDTSGEEPPAGVLYVRSDMLGSHRRFRGLQLTARPDGHWKVAMDFISGPVPKLW